MIEITKGETYGWETAIRGMRNPMNSWDKSDTAFYSYPEESVAHKIGENDLDLMLRLIKGGTEHRKFLRMIVVTVDINAPLYWWKEFDTYKVGTVANSCSTMHKIHSKEFTLDDFSHDQLIETNDGLVTDAEGFKWCDPLTTLETIINNLNAYRDNFIATKDKRWWWQMIQLLPSSYNQKRTVQLNYEVLLAQYRQRNGHKLDEWRKFCEWIESLPYMSKFLEAMK